MTPLRFNPVVHLELHTGDLPQARDLYAELCGWHPERIETRAGSYLCLELGNGLGGGIVECEIRHPRWLPYVEVSAIADATRRARDLGASLLLAARSPSGSPRPSVRRCRGLRERAPPTGGGPRG